MAGAGILTGNKSLTKLGSILSLAGGVANLASSMGGGASAAAGEAAADAASSAWDGAGSAAGSDAAQFAKYSAGQDLSQNIAQSGPLGGVAEAASGASSAADALAIQPFEEAIGSVGAEGITGSDMVRMASQRAAPMSLGDTLAAQSEALAQPFSGTSPGYVPGVPKSVLDGASQLQGADHMNQLLEKVKGGVSSVGKFVKDNKELALIGGSVLNNMYGPQAEALDFQKNLWERRRKNLNSPIRMTVGGGT